MTSAVQVAPRNPVTEQYEALLRVSQTLISSRCCDGLMGVLARELRKVLTFQYLGVAVYDEKAHDMRLNLFHGESGAPLEPPKLAPEETMSWWVYQHQQPLAVPFVDEEARFPAATKLLKELGIRSICILPLTTVHRRVGGLAIGRQESVNYSRDEVSFLSLVAHQVALAMDDALNFEMSQRAQEELRRKQAELQAERDRLQLLLSVTNQVVSNLELRDLLRTVSASVRRVMQCDAVGVALPDSEGNDVRLYAFDFPGSKGAFREGLSRPLDGDSPGWRSPWSAEVMRTGQPLNLSGRALAQKDPPDSRSAAEGIQSLCLLPLISRKRRLGVLGLGRREDKPFTEDEVEFLMQVASQVAIAVENASAYRQIADLKDKLAQEKLYLEDEIRTELNFEPILGASESLRRALRQVDKVAPTDSTVLIYGETGTGKELIARAIHDRSARRSNAFVKLNCAAIPTGLLESELFGHEKGAFTGAVAQRIGRFELANHGTIFLDEVGEIPVDLQPKLLRVLQEREFERLGSSRTLRTDARLIAATNRDLGSLVEERKFRADLFYRLNVFPIHVPPLRERPEDIPLLVRHFAQQFSRRMNKRVDTIPSETLQALIQYHWPGNIRELQNLVERGVILSSGSVLRVELPNSKQHAVNGSGGLNERHTLEETERKHILAALEDAHWVLAGPNGAAARLGLKRSTLQYRINKLGLSRPESRTSLLS
jgi:formate hydrogenlyase transcriptional activator